VPANFLDFGNGDTVNPLTDDGGSQAIPLQQPIKYFGRTHSHVFVNNNGLITFLQQLAVYIPIQNPGIDFVAPLWIDLDNRNGGTVSYREHTSGAVLAQATAAIREYFPNIPFAATSAFVATWDNVPYYLDQMRATFQVVIVSSVHRSFILFNYGNIAQTARTWVAGYNTMDNVNSFRITVASAPELSSSSNTNVNGRWALRVDGSLNLPTSFLPFGDREMVNPPAEDGSSEAIILQQPFKYFGRIYNQIFVNNNGHLTFTEPLSAYNPSMDSRRDIIAPLWTHLDNRRGGTISYREDTSSAVLAQVTAVVHQYFPNIPFTATSVFVATWDSVPYYNGGGLVTFQVVLVFSVHRSFILINYGNIAGTEQIWQAGYNTADFVSSFTIPVTNATELSSSSNIDVNGHWSFHVDGSPNCEQQCHLTFTEPLSAYNSSMDSGRDIIAPLWTRLDNRRGGTISYRENTSSAVLAQVTAAVHQYFPNIPFAATSVFVATWDSVPYYNGGGLVTFQVVLVFSVHRSFILINYGNIAGTEQIWQVNNNGHLTFTEPLSAYNPSMDSGRDIIAPLWTRLDNRHGGTISYREDTSSAVLAQVTAAVHQYFPNIPFTATSVFVATWDSVPYYNGGGLVTFQVVLVFSVHRTFILINYGDIAETGQIWLAGYNTVDSASSFTIPVTSAAELTSSSNINVNGHWSFHVDDSPNLPAHFLPFRNGEIVNCMSDVGSSEAITLQQPFKYFEHTYNQIFVNNNGHLTFSEPLSTYTPLVNSGRDIVAPLWTHLDNRRGGTISYREDTSSAILAQVSAIINQNFLNLPLPFNTTSAFVATWDSVPYSSGEGAHYDTVDSAHSSSISLLTASELSSNSNVNVNGRWGFHVYDDATEVCYSSTGIMSLSRCQLFESDFPLEVLHLNDPNCTGTPQNGRVLFHFDNEGLVCGTTLLNNYTHFIYQNSIQSNLPLGLISRERWMNIAFSCVYPLIQTLSMPMDIKVEQSVVSVNLPGQGTYQIRMIPYHDAQFTSPYQGDVEVQVNQQMYVAVELEGVDRRQIAAILDNCWATPVNYSEYQIRWNLIIGECPNPEDETVKVLQNGIDTTSHFSFRMFTFTGASDRIFLHCQVHLCLVQSGRCAQSCNSGRRRRRRRSLEFHHSAAISMGL
ncbi:Pancreatic secretory granule membrane major glycoprotein GP2, partial [Anabarilius grahami]